MAPKSENAGEVRVEISANGQQWQDTKAPLRYYSGPKVTSVFPTYGVTKNPHGLDLDVRGENFACPNGDCSRIRVRFTNDQGDKIDVVGKSETDNDGVKVTCKIPKYPAPETLLVDVSFNDLDYTADNVTFGFVDPYVLGISPRLISTHGTTKVNLTGYGFVQLEEAKS